MDVRDLFRYRNRDFLPGKKCMFYGRCKYRFAYLKTVLANLEYGLNIPAVWNSVVKRFVKIGGLHTFHASKVHKSGRNRTPFYVTVTTEKSVRFTNLFTTHQTNHYFT